MSDITHRLQVAEWRYWYHAQKAQWFEARAARLRLDGRIDDAYAATDAAYEDAARAAEQNRLRGKLLIELWEMA